MEYLEEDILENQDVKKGLFVMTKKITANWYSKTQSKFKFFLIIQIIF